MALKVLLADDSAAIKKVVQLSLQDLGVELKTIGSGKDAIEVAKQFKPDIAFIDVMLPQKSGYEIAAEMRKESTLKALPIVLLWSAFMAFDDAKYNSSGANAKLEKPFESNALRTLVGKLVPKASNPLTDHIDFPKVEFEGPIGTVPPPKKGAKPAEWTLPSFKENSLPPIPTVAKKEIAPRLPTPDPSGWTTDNDWVKKDLGKFKVAPPESEKEEVVSFDYPENEIVDTSFLFKPSDAGIGTLIRKQEENTPIPEKSLSLEELSDLKLETRQMIEKVVWKLVPEIATQIIKEELDRLLAEEP